MIGDYVRAGEAPSKKKHLTVLALLGLVGVVAIVGIVAHNHGKSTVENQALAGANPAKSEYEHLFRAWMKHFGRNYADFNEYIDRFDIFVANYKFINHHNSQGYSYTLGVNHMADLTREEFKKYYTGVKPATSSNGTSDLPTDNLPDEIDWSVKGAVTDIKNQGQCGSCWAFSATGALEGLNFIKNGKLESFSEQQLVDCSGAYGNEGCSGGLPDDAFKYVEKYGIELESDYGYKAVDGTCKYDKSKVAFKISGYKDIPQRNNLQLKAAVAQQPVSVGIEADQYGFQFYSGGVFTGSCGTSIDHGVLAVGYGTDDNTEFWKVKNSWGASWGEEGYIRMERTDGKASGKCGIALMASYPTA